MSAARTPYDALVAAHGLSTAHRLLVAAVPPGSRVLDVGCSTGYLAELLAANGCRVVGVEADDTAAARARARDSLLDVLSGSIDDPDVRGRIAEHGPYDAIVCGDVLEHLPAPEETLGVLATQLAPGGRVVVSLPNVAHWTGRRALLRGRFPRERHGLFDATHLRWFTRAGAHALVAGAGLQITAEAFAPAPLPLQAHIPALARAEGTAARCWPELFALQVVLTGQSRSDAP